MALRIRASAVLALAAILCAGTRSADAQVASPRTVLTIHSGAESFPSNPLLDAGIRDGLAASSGVPIDYLAEYLEADLFPTEAATLAFKDYLRRKYQGRTIDLVIAMTDVALRFVLDHRAELFPDAPVIFFALAGPDEATRNVGGGITGVTVAIAYGETLKLALALHPSTQHVFVVARRPENQTLDSVRAEFGRFSGRVRITYVAEATLPLLLSTVRRIPQGSLILYIWHGQAEPGSVVDSVAVARLVADAATVPVYGTSDLYIGSGVVGGVVRGTRETGTRVGDMALRVLAGTRPQDIPIETARVAPVIDWRQVQRWSIDPSRIPPGSRIEYRDPTVWERYRVYIVGTVTVLLAQAALIAGLVIQRTRRRKAEQQVRRSEAALQTSYHRIRDLGSRLLNAQEDERARIARDLHDDISQQLAVLKMALKRLGRAAPADAAAAATTAEAVKRLEDIAVSVHDLSHRLHPARLRVIGLVDALNGLQGELSHPGMTITFTHERVPLALPPDLTLCLYRIVQEALHNARKYSEARSVAVTLTGGSHGIALTIVDDGVGFDVNAAWRKGLGLISIRERVEAIGGTFALHSSPGAGTRLEVNVPVAVRQNTSPVAV
jgi:signal transduction histidine kinase